MRDFFAELRRRHVYKVAVFYAAGAWILIQIADIVLANFSASDQMMQAVILLMALGFPVALMLAWVYDLTPRGAVLTPPEGESHNGSPQESPGIVVLRFDNFSGELEDEVLCNGFTEDLTTLLAQLGSFVVIAGNSADAEERSLNASATGVEPGVRYVLQGSLRRMGDQVRVTAQLTQVDAGRHLWAQDYDTNIEDLHKVQDQLLRSIAAQLGAELAPAE